MYRGKSSKVVLGGTESHFEPLTAKVPDGSTQMQGGQSTSIGLAGSCSPAVLKGLF